jgi:hypothetical protein
MSINFDQNEKMKEGLTENMTFVVFLRNAHTVFDGVGNKPKSFFQASSNLSITPGTAN